MQFHEKLRILRKAKGHSQTDLAALTHVSKRSQSLKRRMGVLVVMIQLAIVRVCLTVRARLGSLSAQTWPLS